MATVEVTTNPAAPPLESTEADLKFLADLAQTRGWSLGVPSSVRLTPDGRTVVFLRTLPRDPTARLFAFDVQSGREQQLLAPEEVLAGEEERRSSEEKARHDRMRQTNCGFSSYDLSDDGATLLVGLNGSVYVRALAGGVARQVVRPGPDGEPAFDPRFSPDGKNVSFVRRGELWVAAVEGGVERQITHGATENLTHAQAEFVAREEFARFSGYWWSPDSKSLVFEEADLTDVEKCWLGDLARPELLVRPMHYPRPGKPNAKVSLGVVAMDGGEITWLEWDRRKFEYVVRVQWDKGGPLTVLLLTRDQKFLSLVEADVQTGKTHELLAEHDDAWLNVGYRNYEWLRDGSGFLWSSELAGVNQLELHAPDGAMVRTLTPGTLGFAGLKGIDLKRRMIYIAWAPEPVEEQIARVPLDGGRLEMLTRGPHQHSIVVARDSLSHVVRAVGLRGNPRDEVFRADGSSAGEIANLAEACPFECNIEIVKLGLPDGRWTAIVRPRDFDTSRKYPVIQSVHGGPGSNQVTAIGRRYLADQWLADHGYIVVFADGHGTAGRGRAWERTMLDAFAEVPVAEQVAALREAAEHEPAMDLSRVGVIGYSFGGFAAALSLMKHPDIYRAGVAGGTVVDWMNYDTAYAERHLGIPPPAGSSDSYSRNGLLRYVQGIAGPVLLIHGTADDNVHFSETLLLADALFRAGKKFELLPVVGETHVFSDPLLRARCRQKILEFFQTQLGAAKNALD